MSYASDSRVVLTLDAGGTNFVFSAVQSDREVVEPITLPSNADDLKPCLGTIVEGFTRGEGEGASRARGHQLRLPRPGGLSRRDHRRPREPARVPRRRGPRADARGALRHPDLHQQRRRPVRLRRGHRRASCHVNGLLEKAGSPNATRTSSASPSAPASAAASRATASSSSATTRGGEIWLMRNKLDPKPNAEEGVSIRAVRRVYAQKAGIPFERRPSRRTSSRSASARRRATRRPRARPSASLGEVVGDAMAHAITLIDGLVVIGGGLSAARRSSCRRS